MSTVQEIKCAIEQLPRIEMGKLAKWLSSKFAAELDRQIAEDINAGRLEPLDRQAIAEIRLVFRGRGQS